MTETRTFTEQSPTRVFLLDDHEVVQRGITDLLDAEPDISVTGDADTVEHALVRAPALRPDVVVLDVRLPDGDGITVYRELGSRMPELACLMLMSFDEEDALPDAIMAGASGLRSQADQRLRPGLGGAYGRLRPVHAGPCNDGPADALAARRHRPGEGVFGTCGRSFAQFACAKSSSLEPGPAGLTFEQAAALPRLRHDRPPGPRRGPPRPDQQVLVIGASGGVGTYAIQLAVHYGAQVTGVADPSEPTSSARSAQDGRVPSTRPDHGPLPNAAPEHR